MPAETRRRGAGLVTVAGQDIAYSLQPQRGNGGLRVRVGPGGVEVLYPPSRTRDDVDRFLRANGEWLLSQFERLSRIRSARQVAPPARCEILLRGCPTAIEVESVPRRARSNQVRWDGDELVIARGLQAQTTPARTLENWLRRQARADIAPRVRAFADAIGALPGRLYIMDQKTKWGNCSARGNLSFNWRIVMAPPSVLEYLVAHEVVHLAVPNHSHRFWLTLHSLHPQAGRAREWLAANGHRLLVPLPEVVGGDTPSGI